MVAWLPSSVALRRSASARTRERPCQQGTLTLINAAGIRFARALSRVLLALACCLGPDSLAADSRPCHDLVELVARSSAASRT